MTRFARAKGSKASNERLPEPPTSWSEMKETLLSKKKELEEQKNRDIALQKRDANYKAFLKEKEEENDKKISWAEFPEAKGAVTKQNGPNKRKFDLEHNKKKEAKKIKGFKSLDADQEESDDSNGEFSALKSQVNVVLSAQKFDGTSSDSDAPPEEASASEKPQEIIVKKGKKPKQKLQIIINQENKSNWLNPQSVPSKKSKDNEIPSKKVKNENISDKEKKLIEKKQERYIKQLEKKQLKRNENKFKKSEGNIKVDSPIAENKLGTENLSEIDKRRQEKKLERRKKQKEKKLQKKQELGTVDKKGEKKEENLTEKDLEKIKKKKERRARQAEKRKKIREAKEISNQKLVNGGDNFTGNTDEANNIIQNTFEENGTTPEQNKVFTERKPTQKPPTNPKPKKAKLKDNKDFQRNKSRPEIMFINGKNVEIDYIEGFPVKKEDADRLRKLRKEMISKGLPRSEINIALKLERRRAEKALAREKKNVCFNCRKSGHNLSECPALDKDQVAQTSGTGICFKCGSTEHTHFECKVVKGLDYKFATCFICKEQGHISRQCPDNQRGLYPKGGSCKVCGDVTHLKKDCPKYQMQQSQLQGSLDIETLDNTNPDDLGSKWNSNNNNGPVKRFNKKIKF